MFFVLNLLPVVRFELIESELRDCSDIGKASLSDEAECREAAIQLGLYYRRKLYYARVPKGCYVTRMLGRWFGLHWNTHPIGASRKNAFPICRKGGNYNHLYLT